MNLPRETSTEHLGYCGDIGVVRGRIHNARQNRPNPPYPCFSVKVLSSPFLNKYIDAMKTEFLSLPSNININTIFWGGGTPTLLSAKHLDELGSSMLRKVNYGFNEWTVEMAPSTVQ